MQRTSIVLLALAWIVGSRAQQQSLQNSTFTVDAILPPFEAKAADAYLCTAVKLPNRALKLIGVESLSDQETVHHMLLFGETVPPCTTDTCPCLHAPGTPIYQGSRPPACMAAGCSAPANTAPVWNCRMAATCLNGHDAVLYGWGKNAPPVNLPDGVGYSVGKGTAAASMVLQVRSDWISSGLLACIFMLHFWPHRIMQLAWYSGYA
jgi:hypothetical protein